MTPAISCILHMVAGVLRGWRDVCHVGVPRERVRAPGTSLPGMTEQKLASALCCRMGMPIISTTGFKCHVVVWLSPSVEAGVSFKSSA